MMKGQQTSDRQQPSVHHHGTRLTSSHIKLIDNILFQATSSYTKVLADSQLDQQLARFFADPMLENAKRVLRLLEELSSCLVRVEHKIKKLWKITDQDEVFCNFKEEFRESTLDPFTDSFFHRMRLAHDPMNWNKGTGDHKGEELEELFVVSSMSLFLGAYQTFHQCVMETLEKCQFTPHVPMTLGFLLYSLGLFKTNLREWKEDVNDNVNELNGLLINAEPCDRENVCGKLTHKHILVVDEAISTVLHAAGPAILLVSSAESKSAHGIESYVNNYLRYSNSVVEIVNQLMSSLTTATQEVRSFRRKAKATSSPSPSMRAEMKSAYKDPFPDDLIEKIVNLSHHSPPAKTDYRKPNRSWLNAYSLFNRSANIDKSTAGRREMEGSPNSTDHNQKGNDAASVTKFLELMYEYSSTRTNFIRFYSDQATASTIAVELVQRSKALTQHLNWCIEHIMADRKKIVEEIGDTTGISKRTSSSREFRSPRDDQNGEQANMRIYTVPSVALL